MAYVIVFVLLVGVVLVITGPLRRPIVSAEVAAAHARISREVEDYAAARIDLEAARDAKYREIRDAELDHQTGKLSDADFQAIDSTLRAEAIELLRRLDALDETADGTEHDEAEEAAE
jgi:hypothetical protein